MNLSNYEVSNLGGYIGANTSEILLQTFGYSSYLICVVLISWSYKLFFSKNLELFALNILMLPVTIFLTSFLFEISNFNLSNGFVAEKLFLFVIEIELIRNDYLFYSLITIVVIFLILSFYLSMGLKKNEWIEIFKFFFNVTKRTITLLKKLFPKSSNIFSKNSAFTLLSIISFFSPC